MDGSKMIHIFSDDKFIDPAIRLIDPVCPGEYYVIKNDDSPFRYVTSDKARRLVLNSAPDFRHFSDYVSGSGAKAVFFHALNLPKQQLTHMISADIVKIWLIWGFDLYGNWPVFNAAIYHPETKKFLESSGRKASFKSKLLFNDMAFGVFSAWRKGKLWLPKKISNLLEQCYATPFYEAAAKMDIIVPIVPTEFDMIEKLRIKAIPAPFQYTCIEYALGDKINNTVAAAGNILVGNSADPTNNHVDVFKKIKDYDLGDRLVYVPLSYSGTKEYIDFVIEKGHEYLGKNFRPLTGYLPLEDYNKLVASCGFVIFNHVRQQGLGNILAMGYWGAKIFMDHRSPIYKYLKGEGMILFDTAGLNAASLAKNLSQGECDTNRQVLHKAYSETAVRAKIEEMFSIAETEIRKKSL